MNVDDVQIIEKGDGHVQVRMNKDGMDGADGENGKRDEIGDLIDVRVGLKVTKILSREAESRSLRDLSDSVL